MSQRKDDNLFPLSGGEVLTERTGRPGGHIGHQRLFAVIDGGQEQSFGLGTGRIEEGILPDIHHPQRGITQDKTPVFTAGNPGPHHLLPGGGGAHCAGTVEGGPGSDRIVIAQQGDNDVFGGTERDTIDLRNAPQGMYVDLASGHFWSLGSPPIGSLVFETENVLGSDWPDEIYGNGRPNRLFGFDGSDTIHGRGGNDYLDGGAGIGDLLYGDSGFDTCVDGETEICEG